MLWQSGAFRENQDVHDRVMDSNDLERERGITILAKNTAVRYGGTQDQHHRHARARRLRRRGRASADDGRRRPAPGRRRRGPAAADALRAAQGARAAAARDPRRSTRSTGPTPASPRSSTRSSSCSSTSTPTSTRSISRSSTRTRRAGLATLDPDAPGQGSRAAVPDDPRHVPPPSYEEGHPLQALVTNLDASPYLGRLALCRIAQRRAPARQTACCVPRRRHDGARQDHRLSTVTRSSLASPSKRPAPARSSRSPASTTSHRRDAGRPRRSASAARDHVDEPSLSMTIGINTSPPAGLDGKLLTARQVRNRLEQELVGNVSLRVLDRRARRLGRAGPRRAAARGPGRDDAARGLRAHGRQAAGRHPRDRRRAARAVRAASRSTCPRTTSASSRSCSPCARADGADGQPRPGLGPPRLPRPGARPDRLPHRVPDRDARHRHAHHVFDG